MWKAPLRLSGKRLFVGLFGLFVLSLLLKCVLDCQQDTRESEDSLKWTFLGDESKTPRLDCKWSPDSKLVSFIRDGNIWLIDFDSGEERQLTFSSGNDVTSGVAEFVMQEEFSRHTGYWWCPTNSNGADS